LRPCCSDAVTSEVTLTANSFEINTPVFFYRDSHDIIPRAKKALDQVAALLAEHAEIGLVRLEGYADRTGSFTHNLQLSADRARSVQRYLVERTRPQAADLHR